MLASHVPFVVTVNHIYDSGWLHQVTQPNDIVAILALGSSPWCLQKLPGDNLLSMCESVSVLCSIPISIPMPCCLLVTLDL